MTFDIALVRRQTINPISEVSLPRVVEAMSGLLELFGEDWLDRHLYFANCCDGSRHHQVELLESFVDFEPLTFLWEDLAVLRGLTGFDQLQKKMAKGLRTKDVDLEISVTADLCRLTVEVELEPSVGGGKHSDSRFRLQPNGDWTFAEVTRRSGVDTVKNIQERGRRLASLVAARDPSLRQFIAVTRSMDKNFSDAEFEEVAVWIPGSPQNANFKDVAFVGSVPHNTDESQLVLPHIPGPVSVIQDGNIRTSAFGVAYLRVPDFGAEKKLRTKSKQANAGAESLLFIDLTETHATQAEWDDRIATLDAAQAFSAIVTMRNELGIGGSTRRCRIIEPQKRLHALSEKTRSILNEFANMRVRLSLI